jgi:hypothetical protein
MIEMKRKPNTLPTLACSAASSSSWKQANHQNTCKLDKAQIE